MATPFISDEEILKKLKAGEDSFVERKSFGDWKKDAVNTCVAFANSCPIEGAPGLLCIGVKNDGGIERSQIDLDTLQKTLERELEDAYPPIPHRTRVVSAHEGKFIAVVVPGSSQGPHFSGPAYVRSGPTNAKASKEQFERLVDRRERKVREILKWQNKAVKLVRLWAVPSNLVGRIAGNSYVTVIDCTALVVKVEMTGSGFLFFPLDHVILGHDAQANCLTLEVPQD
ncbi:MAG TPA: ATP-binding protein [Candidatus Acidoferrales bacterium]|nr:ATP-binding protein [Candidatus Acidoferrales bacterium]